jgi:hypothetical protein
MERIEKQVITPEIAEQMLSRNIKNNRPVSNMTINQYAIDMTAGKWMDTADSIKFDTEGNMIDGQHRLHAIIKAGISVEAWVATELNAESVRYIDTGRKRTANDLLQMAEMGGGYVAEITAVTRKVISWQRDTKAVLSRKGHGSGLRGSISNHQILQYALDNPTIIQHAQFGKQLYAKTPVKVYTATDIGFLSWLFSTIDPEKAAEFLEKACLKDNVPADSPIACLYNRLLNSKEYMTPLLKLKLTFHAWNLWRENKKVYALKVSKMDELPELI